MIRGALLEKRKIGEEKIRWGRVCLWPFRIHRQVSHVMKHMEIALIMDLTRGRLGSGLTKDQYGQKHTRRDRRPKVRVPTIQFT